MQIIEVGKIMCAAMDYISVLHNFSRTCLYYDPFPHIVIEDALDDSIYSDLSENFPDKNQFLQGVDEEPNRYYWLEAVKLLRHYGTDSVWNGFVSYHTSTNFIDDILACLKPTFSQNALSSLDFLSNKQGKKGVRFSSKNLDVAFDCQAVYCSTVKGGPASPRGPHVDREVTAFSGLLYLSNRDNQSGGDLLLYRRKPGVLSTCSFNSSNHISRDLVEEVKRIPIQENMFVGFLNGPDAIHGVSSREQNASDRRHVNIIVESGRKIFELNKHMVIGSPKTNSWYGNQSHGF